MTGSLVGGVWEDARLRPRSWSGCRDLNPGPLDPQSSALTKLRHSPCAVRPVARVLASRLDGRRRRCQHFVNAVSAPRSGHHGGTAARRDTNAPRQAPFHEPGPCAPQYLEANPNRYCGLGGTGVCLSKPRLGDGPSVPNPMAWRVRPRWFSRIASASKGLWMGTLTPMGGSD